MKAIESFAKLAKKLRTPLRVQKYLRTFEYNRRDTLYSAKTSLTKQSAHCLEGAFVVAAILENLEYPPLILSFESIDNLDHVVYVFKEKGRWGSIGISRDSGLQGRKPRFKTLRSLAWSYFDPYIDKSGKITAYQLFHLDETLSDWRLSSKNLWHAEKFLIEAKHIPLKSSLNRYKKLKNKYLRDGPLISGKHWW